MKRQRTYTREEYAEYEGHRRGLGQGLTFAFITGIAGAALGGMVTADWMRNNQIAHDKTRTEDVQYYQPQIQAQLEAQGIDLAEGTLPLISADTNTFSFQLSVGGINKICTARFREYYSTARLEPNIAQTMQCKASDKDMPSTPPEGFTQ